MIYLIIENLIKEYLKFMDDLGFFERVIKTSSNTKSRLSKIFIFVAAAIVSAVWIIFALPTFIPHTLIFIVTVIFFSVAFLVVRGLSTELEYSISETYVSLAKIYGRSGRKTVFEADRDNILMIAPKTEVNLAKAKDLGAKTVIEAVSSAPEYPVWLMVFKTESGEPTVFVFEANDYAVKLLKMIKPSVMIYR